MERKTKKIIFHALLSVFVIGGLIFYFSYSMNIIKQDYNAKLEELNRQLSSSLQKSEKEIKGNLFSVNSSLSKNIEVINSDMQQFREQNKKEINALSSLVDQIEKNSDIKLGELKNEIKDIKISSADFSAIIDDVLSSVVSINTNLGSGSGAVISEKGYIATNLHVVNGASYIRVMNYQQNNFNAELIGYNSNADIAVLKINSALPKLEFGDSDEVKQGTKVIALGNPAGLSFTVTEGIVSALRVGSNKLKYIQTDVPINPGNSGGPLVDQKGKIIGINNFKISGFESLGFALASNEASKAANEIISEYEAQLEK